MKRKKRSGGRRGLVFVSLGLLLILSIPLFSFIKHQQELRSHGQTIYAKRVVAYFVAWGVYGRNYHVANIPADKVTHINYAFSNITNDKCALGDPYADVDKAYPGDSWDTGAVRGSFNQLKKLKAAHPNVKVMISVGGWTWSSPFSDLAQTDASRQSFVKSCIDLYLTGKYAGIFDGIDIDWEFPVSGGPPGNRHSPNDKHNYTLLMAEFRKQLNALSAQTNKQYLLSIAAPPGADTYVNLELSQLAQSLDYINIMAYDYHGGWDKVTNFNAPLYKPDNDPSTNPIERDQYNDSSSVEGFLAAGVPAEKLNLGMAFYGRGYANVPNTNNGLFQTFTGVPTGSFDDGTSGATGVFDYKDVKARFEPTYTKFRHPTAQIPYLYNPSTKIWINYDDPESITAKVNYLNTKGLGGAMIWELSGDDGSLMNALVGALETNPLSAKTTPSAIIPTYSIMGDCKENSLCPTNTPPSQANIFPSSKQNPMISQPLVAQTDSPTTLPNPGNGGGGGQNGFISVIIGFFLALLRLFLSLFGR